MPRLKVANAEEGDITVTIDEEGVKLDPACQGLRIIHLAGFGREHLFDCGLHYPNCRISVGDIILEDDSTDTLVGGSRVVVYHGGNRYLLGTLTSVIEGSEGT